MFERVNLLLRDYSIDYEEYFNRSRVGCDTLADSSWNIGNNWYCDLFTSFWNKNSFSAFPDKHNLYYCSSVTWYTSVDPNVFWPYPNFQTGCSTGVFQSFGQYALQFLDVKTNADFSPSVIDDSDDLDLGKWPEAILDASWVQELYLISQDKQYRVFIRRALIDSWDRNWNGSIEENERLYTLQMLKLRSFDAWNNHDFLVTSSSGIYDWVLDTWTCDYSQWFVCDWNSLGNVYSWYRFPINQLQYHSWWVSLFDNSITVIDWNITVYPTKDPNLAWAEEKYQITPYFTLSLKTKLYAWVWQKKLKWSIDEYQFTLQTTFTTKNNY